MQKSTLILLFSLTLILTQAFGQKPFWIKEGNSRYMYKVQGEWLFKDSLPDGHYCSYDATKKFISVEVSFRHGKKDGIENRYYIHDKDKYATIEWKNGLKNGTEKYFNTNGTIQYKLTFKNGILNGYCEVNWSEGEKNYNGYYKMGYRDSIWTYYDNSNKSNDTSDYWVARQYKYVNGKKYLLSAWNKKGTQVLFNGTGSLESTDYDSFTNVNNYKNGLRNGNWIETNPDGTLYNEKTYKDNLLVKEIEYYDSNKVASISEWEYTDPEKIDTIKSWIDTYITNIFYSEIVFKNTPVQNGHWLSYYENGMKIYEGDYHHGKRVGTWIWYYRNGRQRIIADYARNTWQHFDTAGSLKSNYANEYLTLLTDEFWFLNQRLDASTIILTKRNTKTVTPRFVFHFDGQLEINSFLECGKDIEQSQNLYSLIADTLIIVPLKETKNQSNPLVFRIISVTDDKILMEKIDSYEISIPIVK
ncbi:toxin-antitoxin system YwqK family antitoxin [Ferruginibacter profundus]